MSAPFPPLNAAEREFFEGLLKEVDALVSFWREAQVELQLLIRDPALAAAPNALTAAARVDELNRRVTRELALMRSRTEQWAGRAVPPAVARGTEQALSAASSQGVQVSVGGALGNADVQAMRIISEEILADTDFAIESTRRVTRRNFRATQQRLVTEAAINESLLVSEARLENANQRSKRLQGLLERNGAAGKFVNVNGRYYRLETYADLVARTRLAEATTEASFRATLALGIDTVRVSDHGPTDKFCDPHAGKVFSISGRDTRFPRLRERPPFHPNCRHAITPYVPDLKSDDELSHAIARSRDEIGPGVSLEEFLRASA